MHRHSQYTEYFASTHSNMYYILSVEYFTGINTSLLVLVSTLLIVACIGSSHTLCAVFMIET